MTFSKIAVSILAVLLLSTGSASARTTIVCDESCSRPYQQWVDEAEVPTPDVTITVSETWAPCPDRPVLFGEPGPSRYQGCTDQHTYIQLKPRRHHRDMIFFHELGHVWDANAMQPWQRLRFANLMRKRALPWTDVELAEREERRAIEEAESNSKPELRWEERSLGEWLGDAYSVCARFRVVKGSFYLIGVEPRGGPALQKVCRMIRRD